MRDPLRLYKDFNFMRTYGHLWPDALASTFPSGVPPPRSSQSSSSSASSFGMSSESSFGMRRSIMGRSMDRGEGGLPDLTTMSSKVKDHCSKSGTCERYDRTFEPHGCKVRDWCEDKAFPNPKISDWEAAYRALTG